MYNICGKEIKTKRDKNTDQPLGLIKVRIKQKYIYIYIINQKIYLTPQYIYIYIYGVRSSGRRQGKK